MVFGAKPHFSREKKMILDQHTNYFSGKRWIWAEKPTFSEGKPGKKTQKQSFGKLNYMARLQKDVVRWFSLGKNGFRCKNHTFSQEEDKRLLSPLGPM